MTTPQQSSKSLFCNCRNCGKELEIFSDEFDKKHFCKGCNQEIDFTKCTLRSSVYGTRPGFKESLPLPSGSIKGQNANL